MSKPLDGSPCLTRVFKFLDGRPFKTNVRQPQRCGAFHRRNVGIRCSGVAGRTDISGNTRWTVLPAPVGGQILLWTKTPAAPIYRKYVYFQIYYHQMSLNMNPTMGEGRETKKSLRSFWTIWIRGSRSIDYNNIGFLIATIQV